MRFDKLFPRSKFPGRLKTKVKLPETDLIMRISIFQQKPLLAFNDPQQTCGICRVVSIGNEKLLAYAVLAEKTKLRWFFCRWGDWIDITDNENEMGALSIAEQLLLTPRFIGLPYVGFEDAEWKQF